MDKGRGKAGVGVWEEEVAQEQVNHQGYSPTTRSVDDNDRNTPSNFKDRDPRRIANERCMLFALVKGSKNEN